MKIAILLPYKENYSPDYAGAVSLFVKDTHKISKFKNKISIYGSTNYKKKLTPNYINLDYNKGILQSNSQYYVSQFLKNHKKSSIIEIHNRPAYINYILKKNITSKLVLYFHNDPLTMSGSKTTKDRQFLLKNCSRIIFNSQWSKKRFFKDISSHFINSEKLLVIYQSAIKKKINLKNKKKIITFVGKLNRSKGYDIFGKTITKILNKYPDWKSIVIGDEQRDKLNFKHPNLKILGFLKHDNVLNYLKETSIAVACSRWEEPFGRTSLEASSNGCAVIISNRGGLPETITDGIILKSLNSSELFKSIESLIINKKKRLGYQKLSLKNFFLTHNKSAREIDNYRSLLFSNKNINILKKKALKILHVTNFNEKHDGRLFFNTGKRINNGLIRGGHSVLEFSDRDIQSRNKKVTDVDGSKSLNKKFLNTCENIKPDLVLLGHADSISPLSLSIIKENFPSIKISQWFLDPLNKHGPDYEKNKKRIMDKVEFMDTNFLTTSPDSIAFMKNKDNFFYIPNPCDKSFETLKNYEKNCPIDLFFALSHGVHRGILKRGKFDDREIFVRNLLNLTPNVKFDIYGMDSVQPVWGDNYLKALSNSKMGLNLSRGKPIKYYSSDRITQLIGNGLLTFIDEKTKLDDFFSKNEVVFYSDINDLAEKIQKYRSDEFSRKKIAKKGRDKYLKYFNSDLVAEYILKETFEIKSKSNFIWSDN